jgi:TolB protein
LSAMKKSILISSASIAILLTSCGSGNDEHAHSDAESGATKKSELLYPEESHFGEIWQLTDGGDNAEAYWNSTNDALVFQATNEAWGVECDQIYMTTIDRAKVEMTMDEEAPFRISNGKGRTTCSYFMPGDSTIIYAESTCGRFMKRSTFS